MKEPLSFDYDFFLKKRCWKIINFSIWHSVRNNVHPRHWFWTPRQCHRQVIWTPEHWWHLTQKIIESYPSKCSRHDPNFHDSPLSRSSVKQNTENRSWTFARRGAIVTQGWSLIHVLDLFSCRNASKYQVTLIGPFWDMTTWRTKFSKGFLLFFCNPFFASQYNTPNNLEKVFEFFQRF